MDFVEALGDGTDEFQLVMKKGGENLQIGSYETTEIEKGFIYKGL